MSTVLEKQPDRAPVEHMTVLEALDVLYEKHGTWPVVAKVVGVDEKSIQNWLYRDTSPRENTRKRILEKAATLNRTGDHRLATLGVAACCSALKALEAEEEKLGYILEEIQRSRKVLKEHIQRIRSEVE